MHTYIHACMYRYAHTDTCSHAAGAHAYMHTRMHLIHAYTVLHTVTYIHTYILHRTKLTLIGHFRQSLALFDHGFVNLLELD